MLYSYHNILNRVTIEQLNKKEILFAQNAYNIYYIILDYRHSQVKYD